MFVLRGRLTMMFCVVALLSMTRFKLRGDEPKSSPAVVRVWQGLGGRLGNAIQAQVDRFNETHLDIRVEVAIHNGYSNTLKDFREAVAAGDPPEVAVIEIHSLATLAAAGEIAPVDELMKGDNQFAFDDLLPAALLNLRWEHQIYGLPVTRSTPVLYFNKRRFKAAGLNPGKPPQTWDEFREMARTLTTDPAKSYGFAAATNPWIFESLVLGAGGALIDKNGGRSDFAVSGSKPLQCWADMIHRDKTARLADRNAFLRGEAAMVIDSTAMLSILESSTSVELGVAFIPHLDGQKAGVPTGGGVAVLSAKLSPEKQRAAWKFLTWFIATEQTAELCRSTGYVPIRKSAVKLLEKEGFYARRPNYRTALDQLENAREIPVLPSWPSAMGVIGEALRECLEKDESAEKALNRAAEKADRILRESNDLQQ